MPYCIYDNEKDINSKVSGPGLDMQLVISNILPRERQSILPEHLIGYLEYGLVKELCFNGVDFSENFAEIELIYVPHLWKVESLQTERKINLLDIISLTKRKINLFFQNCSLPGKFITEIAGNPLISTEFGDNVNIDKASNNSASDALGDTSSESLDWDSESVASDASDDEAAFGDSEDDNSPRQSTLFSEYSKNDSPPELILPPQAVNSKYSFLDKTKGGGGFSMFSRSNWNSDRSRSGSSEEMDTPNDSSEEEIDPVKSAKEKAWIERYYKTDEDKAKFVPPELPTAFSFWSRNKGDDDALESDDSENGLSPSKRKKK